MVHCVSGVCNKVRRKEKGWEKERTNKETNPFGWIVKQRLVKLILSCYGLGVLAPTLQLWILKDHSSQLSTLHTKRTHPVFGSGLGKDLFLRKALGEGSWLDLQWYIWIFGWLSIADMCLFPHRFLSQPPPTSSPTQTLSHITTTTTNLPFIFPPAPSSESGTNRTIIQPAPQLKGQHSDFFFCLGIKLHLDYSCTAPLMAQQAWNVITYRSDVIIFPHCLSKQILAYPHVENVWGTDLLFSRWQASVNFSAQILFLTSRTCTENFQSVSNRRAFSLYLWHVQNQ